MKTRSRDQGRTAGIGSVKRPSPGFGAMGETRRKRTISSFLADFGIVAKPFCNDQRKRTVQANAAPRGPWSSDRDSPSFSPLVSGL